MSNWPRGSTVTRAHRLPGLSTACALSLAAAQAPDRDPAPVPGIARATPIEPTVRYGHQPMGPDVADHGALPRVPSEGSTREIRLPRNRVSVDSMVRLAEVTGDGRSGARGGRKRPDARRSVHGPCGLIPASLSSRWMAVAGLGDLDGEGTAEIAVANRTPLRRGLVIRRLLDQRLVPGAALAGVTSHHRPAPQIPGGPRDCGAGPAIILATAKRTALLAVRLTNGALQACVLRPDTDAAAFRRALGCACFTPLDRRIRTARN